jgi:hypothetical protein
MTTIMEVTQMKWKARTQEDRLLKQYWKKFGGVIFTEVSVGRCANRSPRKIDGVRLSGTGLANEIRPNTTGSHEKFKRLVTGANVEVIEVKPTLNRSVIGQAVVGKFLLETDHKATATAIVVCERRNSALQKVCKDNLQVKVWTPRRGFVV